MKLTLKQESFCLAYLETGNVSESYRIKGKLEGMFLRDRQNIIKILASIAKGEDKASERIAAVKELNSMHCYNTPVKNQHPFLGADGKPLNFAVNIIYVSPENLTTEP